MDLFDDVLVAFWKALQNVSVKYILVGDFATTLHGHDSLTNKMEIWIDDTVDNRKALRKAFVDCGMADYPMVEYMQFIPGWTNFHLNNGMELDILIDMKGLEGYSFDECLQMASIADVHGVNVPFLHINQLLENKKIVNRPKDQLDVDALEHIVKLREEFGGDLQ